MTRWSYSLQFLPAVNSPSSIYRLFQSSTRQPNNTLTEMTEVYEAKSYLLFISVTRESHIMYVETRKLAPPDALNGEKWALEIVKIAICCQCLIYIYMTFRRVSRGRGLRNFYFSAEDREERFIQFLIFLILFKCNLWLLYSDCPFWNRLYTSYPVFIYFVPSIYILRTQYLYTSYPVFIYFVPSIYILRTQYLYTSYPVFI